MPDGPLVAYIALGSNLGRRDEHLSRARTALAALPGTRVLAESAIEETEPLPGGPAGQGPFLNQMVAIETTLAPRELLTRLQEIERAEGRERRDRWAPRTLDLDIVMFDGLAVETSDLVVPHPELPNRAFWLRELDELRAASP
jgi:2-amino-4-hydroxy-6-hydroxymethyldihydropteridine diphosphokinase